MLDEAILEQRLAALERAVADLQRQLPGSAVPDNWLEKVTDSVSDEAAFREALELGRAFRHADRPAFDPVTPSPLGETAQTKRPEDLPHGLIEPPERVREIVAKEKARFPVEIFTPAAEERMIGDLTLQYHFEGLGYKVLYRETPHGPEVVAVGFDEIQQVSPETRRELKSWMP